MMNRDDESMPDWVPELMGQQEEEKKTQVSEKKQSEIDLDILRSKSVKVSSNTDFVWDTSSNPVKPVHTEVKDLVDFGFENGEK